MSESEIIKVLTEKGCDTKGALERFLGDEKMYVSFLRRYLKDTSFDNLKAALAEGDLKAGFENAHTLKGLLGNLGLTPLYASMCKTVESLRANTLPDEENLHAFEELFAALARLLEI